MVRHEPGGRDSRKGRSDPCQVRRAPHGLPESLRMPEASHEAVARQSTRDISGLTMSCFGTKSRSRPDLNNVHFVIYLFVLIREESNVLKTTIIVCSYYNKTVNRDDFLTKLNFHKVARQWRFAPGNPHDSSLPHVKLGFIHSSNLGERKRRAQLNR